MVSVPAGFPSFVCGLAFLALAAIAYGASRKIPPRKNWLWLVLAAAAYGLNKWTETCASQIGQPPACELVRLMFWAASLIGLIEFAQHNFYDRRPGLVGRWTYLPCAVLAALCLAGGGISWLALISQLAIAWQCLAIGGLLVRRGVVSVPPAPELAVGAAALAIFAVAAGFKIPVLQVLAALAAVGALWLAAENEKPAGERPSRLKQCRWPLALVATLCVAWFALGGAATGALTSPPLPPAVAMATEEAPGEFGTEPVFGAVARQGGNAGSYALAGGLLVSFVVVMGLLSRLPTFR
jgi:hypothetical protein